MDKCRWRKKSRKKRSRESRRHGSTSPRDGSANLDGDDNNNERSQDVKVRWKEQTREARRLRAALDGRDLDAERRRQVENEADGSGRARRDARWEGTLAQSDTVGGSFRVCFDCSFEERNSLAMQLRHAYAVNSRSSAPVLVYVCGLRVGGRRGCTSRTSRVSWTGGRRGHNDVTRGTWRRCTHIAVGGTARRRCRCSTCRARDSCTAAVTGTKGRAGTTILTRQGCPR